ncbi:MAG TPA: hypothetical protein VJ779_02235 [Acetobacteraceae bacterium]|nr:hypothetical protein [Acetobacteraceae bacterium]
MVLRHSAAQILKRRPDALGHVEYAVTHRHKPIAERVLHGHADRDASNFDGLGLLPCD